MSSGAPDIKQASYGDQHTKYDIDPKEFDKAIQALDNDGVRFITQYDIPYLAGTNNAGDVIYRDRKTPSGFNTKAGKFLDSDRYFKLHERVEKSLLDKGFPYIIAHQIATQVEYAAVKSDGHDVDEYDNKTQEFVQNAGNRQSYQVPDDLCMIPYEDCKDYKTISRMRGLPDPAVVAVAKRIR